MNQSDLNLLHSCIWHGKQSGMSGHIFPSHSTRRKKGKISLACETTHEVSGRFRSLERGVQLLGLSQYGKLAYCILLARCSQYIAVLQYTDVVIIKPVTGRASIRSASQNYKKVNALGFHTEKEVCQHFQAKDRISCHLRGCLPS